MNERRVRRASAVVLLALCACVFAGARFELPGSPVPAGGPLRVMIDVNTASASELELLPRIGPVLAQRIVEDREARGRFESLKDLDRVRGIGVKTLERLRDHVSLD